MSDSGSSVSVSLVEDFHGSIKLYSDGSVVRGDEPSFCLPPLSESYEQVLYKDTVFDLTHGLWARLYLPPPPPHSSPTTATRLPVLLYFHGSGFCLLGPQSPVIHRFCVKWAADIGALIVSVHYRLTPEHRLPTAYHDSISAVQWLHSQSKSTGRGERSDPWFDSHADFSKVFLMGESAGGNIAHRVAMWSGGQDWGGDMRIRGLILLNPFFGGEARTESETKERQEIPLLSVEYTDLMWRLALPAGSNRDHHFCNPLAPHTGALDVWSLAGTLPPTVMVIGGRDILRDKELEYCEFLKKCDKQIIEIVEFEEEDHGFTVLKLEQPNSMKLIEYASHFIKSSA